MRFGHVLSAIVFLGLLSAARPMPAQASCAAGTPEALFAAATVVFRGRAVAIDPARTDPDGVYPAPAKVTFMVERQWKGDVPTMIDVVVNYTGSAGGYVDVRQDQEYLVYALGRYPDRLYSDGCSGMRPIAYASAPLAALGPGQPPTTPGLPNTGGGAAADAAPWAPVLGALLLVALGSIVLSRRLA